MPKKIESLTCYADDKFPLVWNRCKTVLSRMMEQKLEKIANWLIQSGLKVNEDKTGLCLFYKNDTTPMTITLKGNIIDSVNTMNILGVTFDNKLFWSNHISIAITKAQNALKAQRFIKRFFTQNKCYNR